MTEAHLLFLAGMALVAGLVNGVLGHGFSTLLVPPALLVVASRVLNPVLVLVEVFLNLGSLVASRHHLPRVIPGLKPALAGLLARVVRERAFKRFCITFNVFALGIGFARLLEALAPSRRVLLQALWVVPLALVLLRQSLWLRRARIGARLLQRRLAVQVQARKVGVHDYQI